MIPFATCKHKKDNNVSQLHGMEIRSEFLTYFRHITLHNNNMHHVVDELGGYKLTIGILSTCHTAFIPSV